jgi:hypothetical protein
MKVRSKFIVTIMTVLIVTVITIVSGSHASSNLTNAPLVYVPGPSQFYLQHNIVSDGFVRADHTDSNVVNAWGLAQVHNTLVVFG